MPASGWWPLAVVAPVALIAWRVGVVTNRGALTGGFVAGALAWGGGWTGLAMLFTFLVCGSLVSRGGERKRDGVQVWCNGGIAALAALATPWLGAAVAIPAWGGALATAMADTVGGELGRRSSETPRVLLFGARSERGVDGAMTWTGTLAAAGAAALLAVVGVVVGTRGANVWLEIATTWTVAGFVGQCVDSVLGHTVQPKWGARGNDLVNAAATAAGASAAVLLAAL